MPYQHTAQHIHSISSANFEVEEDKVTVKGFTIDCDINYGDFNKNHSIDLWAEMTNAQRSRVQELYDMLKSKVERIVLGV